MVKILLWANIFMILLGFGAYLSPHVSPEGFWIFSILGLFYPWLVFGNLLFVGIWAVCESVILFIPWPGSCSVGGNLPAWWLFAPNPSMPGRKRNFGL